MDREFITIEADFRKDGTVIPVAVIDDDGVRRAIEVSRFVRMVTTKGGGSDFRYDITIDNAPQQIFFEYAESYTAPRRWYRTVT